jgi:hypothetical protein
MLRYAATNKDVPEEAEHAELTHLGAGTHR